MKEKKRRKSDFTKGFLVFVAKKEGNGAKEAIWVSIFSFKEGIWERGFKLKDWERVPLRKW